VKAIVWLAGGYVVVSVKLLLRVLNPFVCGNGRPQSAPRRLLLVK